MQANMFLEKCLDYIGRTNRASFVSNLASSFDAYIDSPIEKTFCVALNTLLEVNDMPFREVSFGRHLRIHTGILCLPQYHVGEYRVDFALWFFGSAKLLVEENSSIKAIHTDKPERRLVVELDGHAFHDQNATQRSYEKKRDRFLQQQGYDVFHYTGADVNAAPFKVALECLAYLTGEPEDCFESPELGG